MLFDNSAGGFMSNIILDFHFAMEDVSKIGTIYFRNMYECLILRALCYLS